MRAMETEQCIHRGRDCVSVAPGIQQCVCGQLFAFVQGVGCSRYKKFQDLTEEDKRNFSPDMESRFLEFVGR